MSTSSQVRHDLPHTAPSGRLRRHSLDPSTCGLDYSDEEREWMLAVERYKRLYGRPFPTCSELLEIAHALGYRKVAESVPLEQLPRLGKHRNSELPPPAAAALAEPVPLVAEAVPRTPRRQPQTEPKPEPDPEPDPKPSATRKQQRRRPCTQCGVSCRPPGTGPGLCQGCYRRLRYQVLGGDLSSSSAGIGPGTCLKCPRTRTSGHRGLCTACYMRIRRHVLAGETTWEAEGLPRRDAPAPPVCRTEET